MKSNTKTFLFIFICLIIIGIGIGAWKLVKTENYVKFKNLGKFPPNGYIQHEENIPIVIKDDKNKKQKDIEYEKHMRYLRDHEKLNSIRNKNYRI